MKQEGSHIDFYASEAPRRLDESPRAQKMTRLALSHWWRPVGSGVMPKREVGFLVTYLFAGEKGSGGAGPHRPPGRPPPGPERPAPAHAAPWPASPSGDASSRTL